jgi:hypothetical protein
VEIWRNKGIWYGTRGMGWAYFEGWLLDVYNYENNEYSLVLAILGINKWTN